MTEGPANDDVEATAAGFEGGLHFLWHLQAIGLLAPDLHADPMPDGYGADGASEHWLGPKGAHDGPKPEDVRIALIDNGVSAGRPAHPNFAADFCPVRVDYGRSPFGSTYGDAQSPDGDWTVASEILKDVEAALIEETGEALRDLLTAIRDEGDFPTPPGRGEGGRYPIDDPADRFATHGTACAGLLVANGLHDGNGDGQAEAAVRNDNAVPYYGVSPRSKLIAIDTVYDGEYWPIVMGLLAALAHGAHVILLPRAIEDMEDPGAACSDDDGDAPDATDDPRFTRLQVDAERWAEKRLLDKVLAATSERVPVVVPAGNEGPGGMSYPATLAGTQAPNLIVVGARTARGELAPYSASAAEDAPTAGVTLFAPSDDREDLVKGSLRRRVASWRHIDLPEPTPEPEEAWPDDPQAAQAAVHTGYKRNVFTPYSILTTDIPGPWGYVPQPGRIRDFDAVAGSGGTERGQHRPDGLYAAFGGTSAAASIVAGTLAQMQAWAMHRVEQPLVGRDAKLILERTLKPAPKLVGRRRPDSDSADGQASSGRCDRLVLGQFAERQEGPKDFLDAHAALAEARGVSAEGDEG